MMRPSAISAVLLTAAALVGPGCGGTRASGARASDPPASTPTPPTPPARSALVDDRILLCARIGLATSATEETAWLRLEAHAAEGGGASVYDHEGFVRIEGQLLNESVREHFDYRFRGRDLVCARTITTTAWTINERTAENPDGPPPFWHVAFRALSEDGKEVHVTVDAAPRGEGEGRDLAATIAFANELRAMAAQAPAK